MPGATCNKGLQENGSGFAGSRCWMVFLEQVTDLPLVHIGSLKICVGKLVKSDSTSRTDCMRLRGLNVDDDGQGWFTLAFPAAPGQRISWASVLAHLIRTSSTVLLGREETKCSSAVISRSWETLGRE